MNLKKTDKKIDETKLKQSVREISDLGGKKESQLQEIDRIAKMLIRRDFKLSEIREKREKELQELKKSKEALMNILEDVEEARANEEEEKNKTLAIINNFTDGLLVFDKENKLLFVNPMAEDLLKVEKKDIAGKSILGLSKIAVLRPLTEVLEKKITESAKIFFKKELKISNNLILKTSIVPVIREKEKIGTLVILHNISREKLVEKLKTEFVSLAAHQLRTPLSAIKWTIKMVLEEDLGPINKEQREFLEDAYESNERMINLINSLLDISRIEEGRYIFNSVLADIEEIAERVINACKKESQKRGIKIEFKKPEKGLPKIMLDVEKMQIVIDNLLKNALKYTLKGGKVTISLKSGKKEIEFSIKDNGVGIPENQQKRIFTKFFRATNIKKMDTTGSGLGLYITKNIIKAHGGKIWFTSKEGQGATFYFTLPIK
jgi:signal transduction histidine kinase